MFDGRDCSDKRLQCNPNYDGYCSDVFNDGRCDEACNNANCGWDGLDCLEEEGVADTGVIPGSFQIVLNIPKDRFGSDTQKRFERYLSLVLRTNLRIKRDASGAPMIREFHQTPSVQSEYAFNTNLVSSGGIIVYLEIDNVKCVEEDPTGNCFDNAEGYANLFGALLGADRLTGTDDWGIVRVGADDDDGDGGVTGSQDTLGIIIGVVVIALVVILLGVVTQTNNRYMFYPITFSSISLALKDLHSAFS